MAGQGHQFPGGFSNNPNAMRNSFVAGPMGNPMSSPIPNQLAGVMSNQMTSGAGMAGMNNQMVQQYGGGMQNQMNTMGMTQPMPSASQSPVPNSMGMGPGMVGNTNMVGNMGPRMTNTMQNNMGVPNVNIGNNTLANNPVITSNMPGSVTMVNPVVQQNTAVQNVQTATAISQQTNTTAQPQQSKEFNTASLCRFGQETVQDIVSRTQEVFQTLKAIQPPNGTPQGLMASNEKKAKVQEQLRTIRLLFKRLRLIFEKCNENCQVPGMEYTHIESLIPKDEYEHNKIIDEKKTSEAYKLVCEENKELTEQMVQKNKQLKEVINNLRTIIWEINVMLNMRRS